MSTLSDIRDYIDMAVANLDSALETAQDSPEDLGSLPSEIESALAFAKSLETDIDRLWRKQGETEVQP